MRLSLNFSAMFATLRNTGYSGWLAVGYVHQNDMNTLNEDVPTQTIAMRDCFRIWQKEI